MATASPGIAVTMTIGAKSGLIAPLAAILDAARRRALTAGAVGLIVYGALGLRRRSDTDDGADLSRWHGRNRRSATRVSAATAGCHPVACT